MASGVAAVAAAGSIVALVAPAAHASDSGYATTYARYATDSPDGYGFGVRECVSFAAYRLRQHAVKLNVSGFVGPNGRGSTWGNASGWDSSARAMGYAIGVRAAVGAIAQWHANERSSWSWISGSTRYTSYMTAGPYGHVAVVTGVLPGNQMSLEQYNGGTAPHAYSTMSRAVAPRYLYVGVSAPVNSLPTALNEAVSSTGIRRGTSVTVGGHLFRPLDGGRTSGRYVRLYARWHGTTTWAYQGSVLTSSTGLVSFRSTPARTTDYLLVAPMSGALRGSRSVVRVVSVS